MNIIGIFAHPDDEILGAGATLARHAARGDKVLILFVADGETSRQGQLAADIAGRNAMACAAARVLGAETPRMMGGPDQRLDTLALLDIVQWIETEAKLDAPTIIYTHHPHDLNADHRIVAGAVMTAFRPLPASAVRAIYACEVPSSTEWTSPSAAYGFVPRRFVNVADTLAKKIEALRCYDNEMRAFPHPRSYEAVNALARWRGATAGFAAAEAFDVLREVVVE